MTGKVAPKPRSSDDEKDDNRNEGAREVVVSQRNTAAQRSSKIGKGIQSRSTEHSFFKLYMLKLHKKQTERTWTVIITVTTMYALFGDDLRLALFGKSYDDIFFVLSTLSLFLFLKELVVTTVADKSQRWTFYFWLDFIATVTMIPDIGWIWDPLVVFFVSDESNLEDVTRGLQASRVGTKSGRVVRIVRLVRLIRIAKLWKVHQGQKGDELEIEEEPSLVGKKMSEMTMRRVIALVLSMLIVPPFFDITFWADDAQKYLWAQLHTLHHMPQDRNVSTTQFTAHIQNFARDNGKLMYLEVCSDESSTCMRYNNETGEEPTQSIGVVNTWPQESIESFVTATSWNGKYVNPNDDSHSPNNDWMELDLIESNYRNEEKNIVTISECYDWQHQTTSNTTCRSMAIFDVKSSRTQAAALNIVRTFFVMFVLAAGAAALTKDADQLVIRPIERMVACVKELAENPMGTSDRQEEDDDDSGYETQLLERTIKKIGKLLQVGFGEAGSAIINQNMLSSGGVIDPMIKGKRITAVFGFCDIRNFTDTTECLQAEVMVYVNKVGDIVHSATHAFSGAANKNIGDAFLLVWRVDDPAFNDMDNMDNSFWYPGKNGNMCDNALIAFLKVLVDLKRENQQGGCLYEYKHYKKILKRFGPDFEIKMGMGLHIGWAIEGAIGSHYKIDASYLSPNVNMSSRLEAATKQFGTPLLLSHWFVDGLSSAARKRCRQIDQVTVKGSIEPMGLWTFDITHFPETFAELPPQISKEVNRVGTILENEIGVLQQGLPEAFTNLFKKGMNNYLEGDWNKSHQLLLEALQVLPDDGPTKSLISVMAKHNFVSTIDGKEWPGYRELTEK